jgi:DNA-3-methyladenine glycosylase II
VANVIWREGTRRLRGDPAFGPLVQQAGPVRAARPPMTHFQTLARAIVFQQLAGNAARAIHGRFTEAVRGDVAAEAVLAAPEDRLRGAGLSRNKIRALRDLAAHVVDGTVNLSEMDALEDETIVEQLTSVWGIGRWTAEMFLMFHLRRPDVWPVDDLGVRSGWARVHGLAVAPKAAELKPLGEPYRPWRSAVAWYCYRAVELLPPA